MADKKKGAELSQAELEALAKELGEELPQTPVEEDKADNLLRAKDLARMAGAEPYEFRQYLRSTEGGHADKKYTRYSWDPEDRKKIVETIKGFKKWQLEQRQSRARREAERQAKKAQAQAAQENQKRAASTGKTE